MTQAPCSWFDRLTTSGNQKPLTTSGNQKPLTLSLSKGERAASSAVSLAGERKERQPWNLD